MLHNLSCRLRIVVALLFMLVVTMSEATDTNIEKIQKDVVGSWIVDVDGETRLRTLNIKGAEPGQDGVCILNSTYGWTDGAQTAVSTKLVVKPDGYSLLLTTQANSRISAEYSSTDLFSGTFSWSSGKVKAVRLERLSAEEISKRASIQMATRMKLTIKQPAADVPASCASFVGGWTGNWPGYGQTWLWIVEVNANCVAKCTNRSTSAFPDAFQSCEIKGGVLARQKSEGMEYYELHGDELWARFVPTSGYHNNTVFRKFQSSEK